MTIEMKTDSKTEMKPEMKTEMKFEWDLNAFKTRVFRFHTNLPAVWRSQKIHNYFNHNFRHPAPHLRTIIFSNFVFFCTGKSHRSLAKAAPRWPFASEIQHRRSADPFFRVTDVWCFDYQCRQCVKFPVICLTSSFFPIRAGGFNFSILEQKPPCN